MSKDTGGPAVSRIYYDGQKPLDNVRLSDGTSDNGEFMTKQDLLAELTRLRGEVERKSAEIGSINDSLGILDLCQVVPLLKDAQSRAETAEARIRELEAEVERLDTVQGLTYRRAQHAENQLAELRARVRPSVEEIIVQMGNHLDAEESDVGCVIRGWNEATQAIHAILPPVPKVLTVEEIDYVVQRYIRNDPMTDVWCIPSGEIPQMVKSIHKAMGGEE